MSPNFIYNRPDMFADTYSVYEIINNSKRIYIESYAEGDTIVLGIWLVPITEEELAELTNYIFKNNHGARYIKYEYGCALVGEGYKKNHFRIDLPDTTEELHKRLSSKGRYNLKREKRIIDEQIGTSAFNEYTGDNVPDCIITKYFEMKRKTHGIDYMLSPKEYLSHYHVTNIYTLSASDTMLAIIFSCEQCEVFYIENISYDIDYAKYSPGQVIYDMYLTRLVEKGCKKLFLAGGDLDYKRRYGSIEEETYNSTIFRNKTDAVLWKIKKQIKTILNRK